MTKLKSKGKCIFCEKMYSKAGISRHLTVHLKTMEKEANSKNQVLHLNIQASDMFLHLLIKANTPLAEIDRFLRAIWLECCGHLSSFKIKGKNYIVDWDSTEFGEKMSSKAQNIFLSKKTVEYEYDFGSTTYLTIQLVNAYHINIKKKILLLSRNEPLNLLCDTCKTQPAKEICLTCIGWKDESYFCTKCALKHAKKCEDFSDYASMPVVNSPRMATCGYVGGTIDTERDGVFQLKK